ncbi:MAG: hypothetical protein EAZ82_12215 [Verrucomicrobia bacterium]|nr:MAG: hypothetical protein EAZ82_12215 [Verrucomicrobiota bacterium]
MTSKLKELKVDQGLPTAIKADALPLQEQTHPVQKRAISEDEAWDHRYDPTWVFPGAVCSDEGEPPPSPCDYCRRNDHTTDECDITGHPADD